MFSYTRNRNHECSTSASLAKASRKRDYAAAFVTLAEWQNQCPGFTWEYFSIPHEIEASLRAGPLSNPYPKFKSHAVLVVNEHKWPAMGTAQLWGEMPITLKEAWKAAAKGTAAATDTTDATTQTTQVTISASSFEESKFGWYSHTSFSTANPTTSHQRPRKKSRLDNAPTIRYFNSLQPSLQAGNPLQHLPSSSTRQAHLPYLSGYEHLKSAASSHPQSAIGSFTLVTPQYNHHRLSNIRTNSRLPATTLGGPSLVLDTKSTFPSLRIDPLIIDFGGFTQFGGPDIPGSDDLGLSASLWYPPMYEPSNPTLAQSIFPAPMFTLRPDCGGDSFLHALTQTSIQNSGGVATDPLAAFFSEPDATTYVGTSAACIPLEPLTNFKPVDDNSTDAEEALQFLLCSTEEVFTFS